MSIENKTKSDLILWTSDALTQFTRKDQAYVTMRHWKRNLNWYGFWALSNLSVKSWTVINCIDATITICTYHGYKDSTVRQKIQLMERILLEKGIMTLKRRRYTWRSQLRIWREKRKQGTFV